MSNRRPSPNLAAPALPSPFRGMSPSRGITISPRTKRLVIGGAAGALALTLGYAFLRDRKPKEQGPRVVVMPQPTRREKRRHHDDDNDRGEYYEKERKHLKKERKRYEKERERYEKERKRFEKERKRHEGNDRGEYGWRGRHRGRDDD